MTVWKRGCERIFLKTAPVANDRAALTVRGRGLPSVQPFRRSHLRRGKFCVRTVRPLYREAIGLFCLLRMRGRRANADDCAPIVVWHKTGDVDRSRSGCPRRSN